MEAITAKDILVKQPSVEAPPKKGSRRYCELITKKEGGEPFVRSTVVHGRRYWQLCQMIYIGGIRKLKVLKHLGTRKPRLGR